jgi:putative thioredoxin
MSAEELAAHDAVIDVTDADFSSVVVEGSKERPVVVDFWAAWCQPCRVLGPVLERIAHEKAGSFVLAKLDVDANQHTASQFRVMSIPTVVAFSGGRPVDQFIGALPEPAVRDWIDRLLPSDADRTAALAEETERSGDLDAAERSYREALQADADNRAARLGLGRVLAGRGEINEARDLLKALSPDPEADRLLAALRVSEWSELTPDSELNRAMIAAAEGRWQEALDGMLSQLATVPEAREAMLDVFAVLGDDDPLTREYQRKLAAALF